MSNTVPGAWRDRYTRVSHRLVERLWALPFVGERLAASEREAVPKRPCRVLFLCKGNICRSVFAERAAQKLVGEGSGWEFHSAGLEARPGSASPEPAVNVASEFGIDLGRHRSRAAATDMLDASDVILVMEPQQQSDVRRLVNGRATPVALLGAFSRDGTPQPVLHDPYGRDEAAYRRCFERIEDALAALVARGDRAAGQR